MGQQLVCDTVRDLLPMYIDHMTSDVSNASIEEHMAGCGECRTALAQMREPVPAETAPEIRDFKKYLKKSKLNLLYWIMGSAAAIAIVTCFIVNLATESRLSWFYIVAAGIFTGYLPIYVAITARRHKIIKLLAALDGCVFLLLGVIQLVLHSQMGIGDIWYWEIGMPIALLWSVLLWICAIVQAKFHTSALTAVAVFCCFAVPGNYLTNVISGCYQGFGDYAANFVSNGLGNVVAAIVLIFLDVIIYIRRKEKRNDGK